MPRDSVITGEPPIPCHTNDHVHDYTEQYFGYYNLQWRLEVIGFLIFYPLIFLITLIAAGLDYLDEKLR